MKSRKMMQCALRCDLTYRIKFDMQVGKLLTGRVQIPYYGAYFDLICYALKYLRSNRK